VTLAPLFCLELSSNDYAVVVMVAVKGEVVAVELNRVRDD
jgi:hypothetical protein